MRHISKERFIATNVQIEFEDGPVSFNISRGATLADISENLDKIGKWHRGQPLSIDVRFKAPGESGSGRIPAHPLISSPVSRRRHVPDSLLAQPGRSAAGRCQRRP
jgi:hypothetical protein